MALELQQLRPVIALAQHGSRVRAASALNISQPALSRSARNLERRFGSGRVAIGGGPYPMETFLGPAAALFVGQCPKISVQLMARDWDDLLRERALDFFVAEISTLQQPPVLQVRPRAAPPSRPMEMHAMLKMRFVAAAVAAPATLLAGR
jgi:DNA-binding transcriptional LysR family regulator